jgi:endonuclease III
MASGACPDNGDAAPSPAPATCNERNAGEVHRRLLAAYGVPDWHPSYAPVDELVLTILSQNTSDINSGRAYRALRGRFPAWTDVMAAPAAEVASAIRPGGLAEIKAPRIQAALQRIRRERGEVSLDFLAEMPTEEALRWLLSLDGVGPKTACIVLLFCFGRPAFPVDTHIARITRRLGLVASAANAEQIRSAWQALVPPDVFYPLHLNLISHGRAVCKAAAPRCPACVLIDICAYPRRLSLT